MGLWPHREQNKWNFLLLQVAKTSIRGMPHHWNVPYHVQMKGLLLVRGESPAEVIHQLVLHSQKV